MLRTTIGLVAVSSFIASVSFAGDFQNKFTVNQQVWNSHSTAVKNIKPKTHGDYTDFSGSWAGVCTASTGETGESTINIINDDHSLELNNLFAVFGSMESRTISEQESTSTVNQIVLWNNDRTVMEFRISGVIKFNHGKLYQSVYKASFSLNNEQLVFKSEANVYEDLTQLFDNYSISCTFDRAD